MSKLIAVKFLKPHPHYSYSAGDEGVIDFKKAYRMVRKGYVEILFGKSITDILKNIPGKLISNIRFHFLNQNTN